MDAARMMRHARCIILMLVCSACSTRPTAYIKPEDDQSMVHVRIGSTADGTPTIAMNEAAMDTFMARWTDASMAVLQRSGLSAKAQRAAKFSITVHGVTDFHCDDAAQFSVKKLESGQINPDPKYYMEVWTTDVCGERVWLIDSEGHAVVVPL